MRVELLGGSSDKQVATDPLDAGYTALAAGEWETAREAFSGVIATAEPRTARAMWARANHAVALTLLGNSDQAREEWRRIDLAGLYSDKPEDLPLANLFLDAASFGLRGSLIEVGGLVKYPQTGPGALVYFFAGVTDYGLGARDAAREFFAKFLTVPPAKEVPQWEAYRAVAQKLSGSQ
jgi:tetratricopeptide (TPR) repeat protein